MKRTINSKHKTIVPTTVNVKENLGFKPKGLWYGFDDSWINWVKDNIPGWLYDNNFELDVETNKILSINNDKELKDFSKKYGVNNLSNISTFNNCLIDWKKVSEDYAGIEIPNYLVNMRLNMFWYYGWDCASGCIWDTSIIKYVKQIKNK